MNTFSVSNQGPRSSNDDYLLSKDLDNGSWLFVICDGMGSYKNSGHTAKFVAQSLSDRLSSNTSKSEIDKIVKEINSSISKSKELTGTTLGAVHISHDLLHLFWVGDVRISLIKNDLVKYQSEDHSLINELKKSNPSINADRVKELSSVVTRSLEGKEIEVDVKVLPKDFADKILITSDGVHDYISTIELESALRRFDGQEFINYIDNRCSSLSRDNYSAIFCHFKT